MQARVQTYTKIAKKISTGGISSGTAGAHLFFNGMLDLLEVSSAVR
jgi:hypothetical protein